MSPKISVHERLFAKAMEKETNAKINAENINSFKPKSYVNKTSEEILKTRYKKPCSGIEVKFVIIVDAISRLYGKKEES